MVIKRCTIFYFTGTGNSYQVARDIRNQMKDFDLLKMGSLKHEEEITIEAEAIGFVFPVYYARMPLVVEDVLKKIKVGPDTYVFAVATHGGAPAVVLKKLASIIYQNGSTLKAGFLLHMPKNYIMSYDTKAIGTGAKIFEKAKKKLARIIRIVGERRFYPYEKSKLMIDTLLDRICVKTINRIMEDLPNKDSNFSVNDACNGCRICEKICPVNNIECLEKPVWKHQCEQCAACIQYCPREAIQWGDKTINRERYRNPNTSIKELCDS